MTIQMCERFSTMRRLFSLKEQWQLVLEEMLKLQWTQDIEDLSRPLKKRRS